MRIYKILFSLLSFYISLSITLAFGPTIQSTSYTDLCSASTTRGTSTQTLQNLFSIEDSSLLKKYITKTLSNINWSENIIGNIARHKNDESLYREPKCGNYTNHGIWIESEHSAWTSFFGSIQTALTKYNISASYQGQIKPNDAIKLQSYINRSCGLKVGLDGKVGIKTLNATRICKPPCKGLCGWNLFESLVNNNALFSDKGGKNLIYQNGEFTNLPDVMHVDPQKAKSIDGLQSYIDGEGKVINTGGLLADRGLDVVVVSNNESPLLCDNKLTKKQFDTFNDGDIPFTLNNNPYNVNLEVQGNSCCLSKISGLSGSNIADYETYVTNAYIPSLKPPLPNGLILKYCSDSGSSEQKDGESGCALQKDGYSSRTDSDENLYSSYEENIMKATKDNSNTCACVAGSKAVEKIFYNSSKESIPLSVCEKCDKEKCNCGIKLNTNVPFIGRCIMYGDTNETNDPSYVSGDSIVVNSLNAFPVLMGGLIKILMSVILLLCFGSLIVAGVMMTIPGYYDTGKGLIKKVVVAIALLGASGTILYLINPNFFF